MDTLTRAGQNVSFTETETGNKLLKINSMTSNLDHFWNQNWSESIANNQKPCASY